MEQTSIPTLPLHTNVEKALKKEFKGPIKAIPQPVSFETLLLASSNYPIRADRNLFDWLYLTGQRISEALEVRRRDITHEEIKGKPFLVIDSTTLKNRHQARRRIMVPLFGFEAIMSRPLWETYKHYKPDLKIHPYTRQMAFNHLNRVSIPCEFIQVQTKHRFTAQHAINPHYLRHCRADHMAHNHGFDHLRLMQFFGWTSNEMPNTYISTSGRNIADAFIHE